MKTRASLLAALAIAACLSATTAGHAQEVLPEDAALSGVSHVVLPQSRGFAVHAERRGITVTTVHARVQIHGRTASTVLEVALANPGPRQAEAVLLLPLPAGGIVSHYDFQGTALEPTATLLRREEARRVYDDIVRRARDPALLEFAGYDLLRSSVFPVPANGSQKVQVRWEQVLPADGNRIDYVLPRSESLDLATQWTLDVRIASEKPVSTVYSPSHALQTERTGDKTLTVRVGSEAMREPGPFRLSCLEEGDGLAGSFFAYPDPSIGGGYFLMVAGLPAHLAKDKERIRREVTIAIDRSGSMAGPKMDQVRAAALQVVEGLRDGEAFNLLDYGTTVERMAQRPVLVNDETRKQAREYLALLRPTGGTNIHDALVETLRQEAHEGMLPIVLFLTDGLPTVGNRSERAIRDLVEKGNPHRRRIFTFGVGEDVNAPLLDRVAEISRATTTYVLPGEDVEVKVAGVFRRLYGPVLADAKLISGETFSVAQYAPIRELIPATVPDLFEGDQFVLLGQYRGEHPLRILLQGNYLGEDRTFSFEFATKSATTHNSFVPRLWAGRRIGMLVDEIRQAGAGQDGVPRGRENMVLADPRMRELVDEIVRLSTEFGVLSEYTAFLATDGTDLSNVEELVATCGFNLDRTAVRTRSGKAAVSQAVNNWNQKGQSGVNLRNGYFDQDMNRQEIGGVRQVSDRAYFKRGANWVDGRLAARKEPLRADRTVEFGSDEHLRIVRELVKDGRQATVALAGGILLPFEGETILINNPQHKW